MDYDSDYSEKDEKTIFSDSHLRELEEAEEFEQVENMCKKWENKITELQIIGSAQIYDILKKVFITENTYSEKKITEDLSNFYEDLLDIFVIKQDVSEKWYDSLIEKLHYFYKQKVDKYFVSQKKYDTAKCPPLIKHASSVRQNKTNFFSL